MGDWWFRQECGCELVGTTDQVFAYDLFMGGHSNEVAPLFPVTGASGPADADPYALIVHDAIFTAMDDVTARATAQTITVMSDQNAMIASTSSTPMRSKSF